MLEMPRVVTEAMKPIHAGGRAVEFKLVFNLSGIDGTITERAACAAAGAGPHIQRCGTRQSPIGDTSPCFNAQRCFVE